MTCKGYKVRAPSFGRLQIPDTDFPTITQLHLGHAVREHSSYAVLDILTLCGACILLELIRITHVIPSFIHGAVTGKVQWGVAAKI